MWCNSKRNPASRPSSSLFKLQFPKKKEQRNFEIRTFVVRIGWWHLMKKLSKSIKSTPYDFQTDCFFLWHRNNFNFRFQFCFQDLCFRIYLWSWRPYMRILWILDQTRNSFRGESLLKQFFVQKRHIKVCCGLIWRQIFVVSKNDCHSMKGYQIYVQNHLSLKFYNLPRYMNFSRISNYEIFVLCVTKFEFEGFQKTGFWTYMGYTFIRVDMVGTNHNKVLTQWRHMPMGQFWANIFLIRITSTYFWASEVFKNQRF